MLQLIYSSAKGASIIRALPKDEGAVTKAMAGLAKRHIEARLMSGSTKIGEVYKRDGQWRWIFDPAYCR